MAKKKTSVETQIVIAAKRDISTANEKWLRNLRIISHIIQNPLPGHWEKIESLAIEEFAGSIVKLNDGLNLLSFWANVLAPDDELIQLVETISLDMRLVTPHVRRLYENLPQAWFPRNTVVSHCEWHSLTWSDIVLQAAEHTCIHARYVDAIKAGRSLWKLEYNSSLIQPNLELEFEFLERRFHETHGDKSDSLWTPEAETEARRLIDAKTVKTATALQTTLSINRRSAQELFRYITHKTKKKHRVD
ncbi:MAG: hypothetical protein WKF77_02310 [Planctomycetaceae bacterium]